VLSRQPISTCSGLRCAHRTATQMRWGAVSVGIRRSPTHRAAYVADPQGNLVSLVDRPDDDPGLAS